MIMRRILSVISPGPLILAEVPQRIPVRKMRPYYTALMRSHGLRQRDISALEWMSGPEWFGPDAHPIYIASAEKLSAAWGAAVDGDAARLPRFWLYCCTAPEGFVLLRPARAVTAP